MCQGKSRDSHGPRQPGRHFLPGNEYILPDGGRAMLEVKLAGTMCYQTDVDPIEVARAMTSQAA
jgi:hypothetical protein